MKSTGDYSFKTWYTMNQKYQNIIDQYLMGDMSLKDKQSFKQEIEKNTELKEQFEFTKNVRMAVIKRNDRLAQIKEWEKNYKKKNTVKFKRHYIYWGAGVAAVFVVGFFLFSTYKFGDAEDAYSPNPMSYSSYRGGNDNASIIETLANGNFDIALAQINAKEQELETEKLQMNNEKDSVDSEEFSYMQEVFKVQTGELRWLKVHALIGLNRKDEAIVILDTIRQSESQYQAQADSLYKIYKK